MTTLLVLIAEYYNNCLKKNQSTPRPFEHPPVTGETMSKRLTVITVGKMEKGLGYLFVIYRIMYSTQTRFLDDVYPTVCCSGPTPF